MIYICDNCNGEFTVSKEAKCCPFCTAKYIRKKDVPLKKLARIKGIIEGEMMVIIHQNGHLEFLDFKGERTIGDKYEVLESTDINEKKYYEVISNY